MDTILKRLKGSYVVLSVVHRFGQSPDVVDDGGVASRIGQRH